MNLFQSIKKGNGKQKRGSGDETKEKMNLEVKRKDKTSHFSVARLLLLLISVLITERVLKMHEDRLDANASHFSAPLPHQPDSARVRRVTGRQEVIRLCGEDVEN